MIERIKLEAKKAREGTMSKRDKSPLNEVPEERSKFKTYHAPSDTYQ